MLEVVSALIVALIYALYRYSIWGYDHFAKRGIAFTKPVPFLGNLAPCIFKRRSYVANATDLYREHIAQPCYGLFNLKTPTLFVREAEYVAGVLKTDFRNFADRGIHADPESDPLSANLFFLEGRSWKGLRAKLVPVFAADNLKAMTPLLRDSAVGTVRNLHELIDRGGGRTVQEAVSYFKGYALEVIAVCAFGLDSDAYSSLRDDFGRHVAKAFQLNGARGLGQFIRFFSPKLAKLLGIRFIPKGTEDFFCGVVGRELESRRRNPDRRRRDFLQLLMDLGTKSEDGAEVAGLSEREIAAQAFSFIVAGYDTVSAALSTLFYHLSKYPEVQEKVRREAVDCSLQYPDAYESLANMKYLDMTIKESMRIHPVVGGIMRVCGADYRFRGAGAPSLESGSLVVVPVQGLHNDPEYHPEPEQFRPERFARQDYPARGTYCPFGDGQRNCLGKRFALVEMKILTAEILKNFRCSVDPKTIEPLEYDPNELLSKAKGGIWLEFVKLK